MRPTSATVRFKFGDVFPSDDPVAVFVVALSAAFNDLLYTNIRLLGGDQEKPGRVEVPRYEVSYLLRVSFSQLYELRSAVQGASMEPRVREFIEALPEDGLANLRALKELAPEEPWVEEALKYVRNQTVHFGNRESWDTLRWALDALVDEEGQITMANTLVSGMRLDFADLVAIQHLTRKIPEHEDGAQDPSQEVLAMRLAQLFQAASGGVSAALNFIQTVLLAYLNGLPANVLSRTDT